MGLTFSPAGDGPVDIFIALLALLVDEFGVWIDQRAKSGEGQSRNPLQYVVKSGQPRAVRAMLDRGAEVNLRDEDGWTALASICMNSIKTPSEGGPSVADRVETARLLLEAGADFEAESLNGFTPLLTLCTKPCAPLLKLLLSHGADPNHVGRGTGFSPYGWILKMDKHSEGAAECLKLLSSCNGADCFVEEAKADKFQVLLTDLVAANNRVIGVPVFPFSREGLRQRAKQELHVLKTLFEYVGLDPSVLHKRLSASDGNWLEELHTRISALVPDCYLRVYFREPPTKQEFALMLSHSGESPRAGMMAETSEGVSFFDEQAAHAKLFAKWRDRGLIYRASMINFEECVIDPIQHCIGFAVPSDAVLQRMEQFGPIVEVGAGTGYFTAILQARGVDAVAYDLSPPTEDHEASGFFSHTYTDVQEGDAKRLFAEDPSLASRTLLIVWPNNPDREDSHFYEGEHLPPVWDADCLEQFVQAGGSRVIYIGEREDTIMVIRGESPDCGTSSSRRFQTLLKEQFCLAEQYKIPRWYKCEDDVTIWKRND